MTKASIAFELIDALVAQATTALDGIATVYDGYRVSKDPGNFLMIGVTDPFSDQPAVVMNADQEWANANYTWRDEEGDVNCCVYAWNGNADAAAARAAVKTILDAVATMLRSNPSLGIAELLWTGFRLTTQDQDQDKKGAWCLAMFQVHFKARI